MNKTLTHIDDEKKPISVEVNFENFRATDAQSKAEAIAALKRDLLAKLKSSSSN